MEIVKKKCNFDWWLFGENAFMLFLLLFYGRHVHLFFSCSFIGFSLANKVIWAMVPWFRGFVWLAVWPYLYFIISNSLWLNFRTNANTLSEPFPQRFHYYVGLNRFQHKRQLFIAHPNTIYTQFFQSFCNKIIFLSSLNMTINPISGIHLQLPIHNRFHQICHMNFIFLASFQFF